MIISSGANWTGRMNEHSIYQIIDIQKSILYSFVLYGNDPNVIEVADDQCFNYWKVNRSIKNDTINTISFQKFKINKDEGVENLRFETMYT